MSVRPAGLEPLTAIIASRMGEQGDWRISSDEVISALGLPPVDYWRAVHSLRTKIHLFDAVDGFSEDSVGELVTLCELLAGPQAEEWLVRAGLFLPHRLREDLAEDLLRRAGQFSAGHAVAAEELAAMLRFTGSVRRAVDLYLDEHADLAATIGETARAFAESCGMPVAGGLTAARFLRQLFSRHIMEKGALFAGLERRLREAARRLGFDDPARQETGEQESAGRATRGGGSTGEEERQGGDRGRLAWARSVMGLAAGAIGFETLRRRYRELIMRYHPDVNPSGLERCKDVTAAYSLLAARASEGEIS